MINNVPIAPTSTLLLRVMNMSDISSAILHSPSAIKSINCRGARQLSEMLREQEMNKGGGDTSTGSMVRPVQATSTLAEVGITKSMSSRAQKIASVG